MDNRYYVVVPLIALVICQLLKFLFELIKTKKVNFERLINGSGGMPSSHSTLCSSITMLIGLNHNFRGEIFGLSLVLLLIVCYDAMGVRRETEKQAVIINKYTKSKLLEDVGHEPLEVFAGIFLGIIISCLFYICR